MIRLVVLFVLVLAGPATAQDSAAGKVSGARLVHGDGGRVYLKKRGGRGLEEQPFSGVAFYEGDRWRAEMTYSNGILHGPVTVVANNRLLSQFRYERGVKILDEKRGGE
jgi:hypothetical protein